MSAPTSSDGPGDEQSVTPVRFEVAGTEPEAAVRDLAGIYAGKQWLSRRTEGEYSYRYTAVGDSEVSMRRSTMNGFLRGASTPGNELVMGWLTSGSGVPDTLRDRVPLRIGQPTLFAAHREVVFVAADYDQQLVHLDRRFVREVASERFDVGTRDLRFDHLRPTESAAVRHWRDSLGALSRALREGGTDSLVWHEAKRQTADAFLRVVPPQLDRLPRRAAAPAAGEAPGRRRVRPRPPRGPDHHRGAGAGRGVERAQRAGVLPPDPRCLAPDLPAAGTARPRARRTARPRPADGLGR
ncbi:hypothetical protein DEJ15_06040 [Curtobacterium sp. MCJR17_043]|nr:hypothetical protein [Curtobacterium sp. MCJR17_043]WIB36650.1 hypothetical protein DEJ15_06040 [Curtobacterium sp. MCJR17_043]